MDSHVAVASCPVSIRFFSASKALHYLSKMAEGEERRVFLGRIRLVVGLY